MRWFAFPIVLFVAGPALALDPDNGRALYEQHCEGCHGADGFPNLPGTPDLRETAAQLRTDAELMQILRFGSQTMPGFDVIIDRKGLLDVLFHLRSLAD